MSADRPEPPDSQERPDGSARVQDLSTGRLAIRECGITVARVGVARLHRHLRPPPSGLVAFELVRDGWPIGWAMVGRPVSRVLDADGWVEVTRVAVPSVADGGPRGGCSALYGAAARWARRHGHPILTYTRVDEPGTSPLPGDDTVVYFDPPYVGCPRYAELLPRREVLLVAERWAAAGARVAVSEAEPLPLPGWTSRRLPSSKPARGAARPVVGCVIDTVSALYVRRDGPYPELVADWWDGSPGRDAREYAGPNPVVAHPPCARWGRYWFGGPTFERRRGYRKVLGDDDGCFAAAIGAVERYGGVLEHPEASHAWAKFGLLWPPRNGGWVSAGWGRGWTCCVEQGHYGHPARKATWIYAVGVDLPTLRWGRSAAAARIDDGYHSAEERRRATRTGAGKRLSHRQRELTPHPFAELLVGLAASCGTLPGCAPTSTA